MNKLEPLFSRKSDEWETPQWIFNKLNDEFCFNLDPCGNKENHKCETYFDKEQDGLTKNWGGGAEYFVIHHILKSVNGLKSVIERAEKIRHLLCY